MPSISESTMREVKAWSDYDNARHEFKAGVEALAQPLANISSEVCAEFGLPPPQVITLEDDTVIVDLNLASHIIGCLINHDCVTISSVSRTIEMQKTISLKDRSIGELADEFRRHYRAELASLFHPVRER